MTENLISSNEITPKLTVIGKKREKEPAKLIPLKKIEEKPIILLPPQPENYIKAKKHDFL